ncbi:MAG TPA: type II secretion system F family protein, partial [Candidatus Omnitrophica bacterium]|nr:type II secretion system F family protein [Candidatus Omnitrophota bacterium]
MAYFKYTARTRDGKLDRGFIEAESTDDVVARLQAKGLIVVSFNQAQKTSEKKTKKRFHAKIKLDDLILFSRQLSSLLSAGITLLRSLEIVQGQISSKRLYEAITKIKESVSAGKSMKDAMSAYPKIFSKFWLNLVGTGEATGQLGFALEQMTQYLESRASLRRKIVSALVYPAVVICVAIGAILVFMLKIIPMFAGIYESFGAKLPLLTMVVVNISYVVKKFFFLSAGIAAGIIIVFYHYTKTVFGKRNIDELLLKIPGVKNIISEVAAVRFARGMSMLIK